MKTTAKNYAAQAQSDITKFAQNLKSAGQKRDAAITELTVSVIKEAVHFSIPDNGIIFDDGLKGMTGIDLRLPFPAITIEYHVPNGGLLTEMSETSASKRLVVATEHELNDKSHDIIVYAMSYRDAMKTWVLEGAAMKFNSKTWSNTENSIEAVQNYPVDKSRPRISGVPVLMMTDSVEKLVESGYSKESLEAMFLKDISQEVSALLEFCEALSCSNVSHEPIEKINPAVNARRARDGKLPLYETRCLVINAPNKLSVVNPQGGTHASPRQHLRRGHIRRLPDKNIWVNSCVVAANNPAKIDKSYQVRAA